MKKRFSLLVLLSVLFVSLSNSEEVVPKEAAPAIRVGAAGGVSLSWWSGDDWSSEVDSLNAMNSLIIAGGGRIILDMERSSLARFVFSQEFMISGGGTNFPDIFFHYSVLGTEFSWKPTAIAGIFGAYALLGGGVQIPLPMIASASGQSAPPGWSGPESYMVGTRLVYGAGFEFRVPHVGVFFLDMRHKLPISGELDPLDKTIGLGGLQNDFMIDWGYTRDILDKAGSSKPKSETLVLADGFVYSGETKNGLPSGVGRLSAPDGSYYDGQFTEGRPDGTGFFVHSDKTAPVRYERGRRVDEQFSSSLRTSIDKLKELRTETAKRLSNGVGLDDLDDLFTALAETRADIDKKAESEWFFLAAGMSDGSLTVAYEDLPYSLLLSEEEVVKAPDGTVLKVVRRTASAGFGLSFKKEEIVRRTAPVSSAQFISGGGQVGLTLATGVTAVNLAASAEYRRLGNGGRFFPGIAGGKGGGLDLRASFSVAGSYLSIDYDAMTGTSSAISDSTDIALRGGIGAGLGYSSFRFAPIERDSPEQNGKGWSIGLKALYSLSSSENDQSAGISFEPYFSFDSYRFNPGTAKYRSSSWTFFLFPYPFMMSVGYSVSLF